MGEPTTISANYFAGKFATEGAKTLLSNPKPNLPTQDTKAVQAAAAAEREKRLRAKGFRSTILTPLSPAGLKTKLGQ